MHVNIWNFLESSSFVIINGSDQSVLSCSMSNQRRLLFMNKTNFCNFFSFAHRQSLLGLAMEDNGRFLLLMKFSLLSNEVLYGFLKLLVA